MNKDESQITDLDCEETGEQCDPFYNTAEETAVLEEKFRIITFKVYEKKLGEIWDRFQEKEINPILIKGWAAAINYPKPFSRRLGDFDLAVNPFEFERAAKLQKELEIGDVDLHNGLRKLDKIDWSDLFENSILKKCGVTDIRVLRPEDHLRVLCVHWLVDGGREKEKLRDIYYAVKNRPVEFDWDRCLENIGGKRRKWIIYTIGLAHKYYNLPIDELPFAEEARNLPDWLVTAVENEWNNSVPFKYLQSCLGSWSDFYEQLNRRLPPNPIQSTVNMEGDFDSPTRIFYQIGDVLKRCAPSIKRVSDGFFSKFRRKQ